MKTLEQVANESEMIEVNNTQSGLGRLIRKILKTVLGDYENTRFDPNSASWDYEYVKRYHKDHGSEIEIGKVKDVSNGSDSKEFMKSSAINMFEFIKEDYSSNPKRYDKVNGIVVLDASLESAYKNIPYIIAPYHVSKNTMNFIAVEILYKGRDENSEEFNKFFSYIKKVSEKNGCSKMSVTILAKTDSKEDTSYDYVMKAAKKADAKLDTSSGEGGMYYYTYVFDIKESKE